MAALMQVAVGDCLATLAPPKVAIQYRWPGEVLLNGAIVGEVRLAGPRVPADQVPDWLVVAASLEIAAPRKERSDWSQTSLAEEAESEITRTDVLQSLAAHFLVWVNTWEEEGFRPVHDRWLFRAEGRATPISIRHAGGCSEGEVLGLDEGANLLVKTAAGKVESLAFDDHVDLIAPLAADA
jgi:biotin-(acetyl-CoA carboxylase) ligase